jgi:hypothetical protein
LFKTGIEGAEESLNDQAGEGWREGIALREAALLQKRCDGYQGGEGRMCVCLGESGVAGDPIPSVC